MHKTTTTTIKTAVFWANGTTMAYDTRGEPMPHDANHFKPSY